MIKPAFDVTEIDIFVRNALRDEGHDLDSNQIRSLIDGIKQSLTIYSSHYAEEVPSRIAYNALRQLWQSINKPDPSIGLIRVAVKSLPQPGKEHLLRRGAMLWKGLVSEDFSEHIFDAWLQSANPPELLHILNCLLIEGGMVIDGRKDRQSEKIFEPMIMGVIRGTHKGLSVGGRPTHSSRDELVMNLAIDWLKATDHSPKRGRNGKNGFSGLVHLIFEATEIKGAEQALRRYWSNVQHLKSASSDQIRPHQKPKRYSVKRNKAVKS